jgi:hypothetical protein
VDHLPLGEGAWPLLQLGMRACATAAVGTGSAVRERADEAHRGGDGCGHVAHWSGKKRMCGPWISV